MSDDASTPCNDVPLPERNSKKAPKKEALRILFLSDNRTGGGHQASAEALSKQCLIQFPGSVVDICNLWSEAGDFVSRGLAGSYSKMSARPWQWQLFYHITNTRFVEMLGNQHFRAFLSERVKERITNFSPDVVISVHPTMNKEPRRQCRIIGKELGKHIPFYTVVTDLGSAHQLWFDKGANKVFVASERLREIAKQRGFEDERIIMSGLPIRHGFAHQADKLGDRTCQKGKEYQKNVKKDVNINIQKPMVLVMGGGEGVGSLSEIVDQLYVKLTLQGVDATICVVCGRNETLKKDLESRDWEAVLIELFVSRRKRSPRNARPNRNPKIEESVQRFEETSTPLPESSPEGPLVKLIARLPGIQLKKFDLPETTGNVDVIGLGFISNMPEYMVAADVLVTKAGPGTIAEAASVGLPVMLTSFLPGQEAGNVDVVLESGFGDYCEDPVEIAYEVGYWLQDQELLETMSHAAFAAGHPHAADEIVRDIGSETCKWMACNRRWKGDPVYTPLIEMGHKLVMDLNLTEPLQPDHHLKWLLSIRRDTPQQQKQQFDNSDTEGSEWGDEIRIAEMPVSSSESSPPGWFRRKTGPSLSREKEKAAQELALQGLGPEVGFMEVVNDPQFQVVCEEDREETRDAMEVNDVQALNELTRQGWLEWARGKSNESQGSSVTSQEDTEEGSATQRWFGWSKNRSPVISSV